MWRGPGFIVMTVGWLMLLPGVATALSYVMMSDESLLAQSQLVVRATVQKVLEPPDDDPETLFFTRYRVAVHEVLAGRFDDPELVVLITGRPAGKAGWYVAGAPHMRPEEEVLLFLTSAAGGDWQPVQLIFGVFRERIVAGLRVYFRDIDLQPHSPRKSANAAFAAPRQADFFESWIRGEAVRAERYLVPEVRHQKFLIRTHNNRPIRWFAFDEGVQVNWQAVAGGQAGATYDEFAAVEAAVKVWSEVVDTNIAMNYLGPTTLNYSQWPPLPGEGLQHNTGIVIWDDPIPFEINGQLQPEAISGGWNPNKGGTLAIGGSLYVTSSTEPYNGQQYHRAVAGFVITQNGAGSYFSDDSGRNGAEILTHEIGHALSLAHPCDDDPPGQCPPAERNATMRAEAHADSRGASLKADDIAGVQSLYFFNPNLIHRDGFESP